ncbi:MAG TPA: tRNA (adenosine(37)-N6)-threonylcarbamoyltransferase complex transferase subunit TsaD [Phycisphaerales bacterium]|nr:tRNA (adenosine(37)-N6)-threonylcarbamoyltransferase complex transferase subunit TsaD [Phycisphaerales bacterium]
MLILGIESSCDETAASVVQDGTRVLSSIVSSQHDLHEHYAGVVPELASRAHVERILPVIRESLEHAGVGLGMIDAIAVGNRPGLIGSLLVGVAAARALAWSLGKPLVGIDHVHAHLYSGMLHTGDDSAPAPVRFPALGLVVSGGHTSIYRLDSWTGVTRLGATIDDAIGEAYDKAATILGLPYPGGPNLDRLASTPGANPDAFELPISRISPDSLDFSFSGLKTAVLYAARGVPGRHSEQTAVPPLDDRRRADLAASFQKAAADAVLLKLTRALDRLPRSAEPVALLTGGGVTANSRLRADLQRWSTKHRVDLRLPARAFTVDNAAMIAGLAHEFIRAGQVSGLDLQATPTTAC